MKKRKILSLFLSLCLLIGLLPTVALAADQEASAAGVQITEESYDSTTSILTVNVQIKMPDNSGINTVGSLISYDSSKLTLMDASSNTLYTATSSQTKATSAVIGLLACEETTTIPGIGTFNTPYTVVNADLYGVGSRAGLFVGMSVYPGNTPKISQKTTDWLTIYQLRFKVTGDPTAVLNSDSLRIADPAKDNDVIKGSYVANDEYTVSVNSYGSKWFKYGKMQENKKPDLTGDQWAIPAANVTATYPGSTNSPSPTSATLTGISVKTAPTKVIYTEGESFDKTGMVIEATYSDSTKKEVTGYTYAPTAALTTSDTTITISYTEGSETKTCTQTITVNAAPTEYTISFDVNGGSGTIPSQTTSGQKLSSLPTATHSGSYSFVGWYTAASGGTKITTAYVFSGNTTVYAHWTYTGGGGGGGSYTPSYSITVDKTENGTITVSPKSASKGDTVTITVKPDKGYELEMLKALDKDGDALKLTEKNGKYTFKMPSGKVTVKGSFVEEAPVQIFKDVPVDAYYYEAVKWAAEKGITGGVGNGLFAPNQPCTRAQIVTFLWRAAGSPEPKTMSSFADVPADAFYAKAVAWAVENGITGGTGDGKFSPDATCTRAQAVTFLYRASGAPAVSGNAAFSDVATNAYYAAAVKWAEKNGITGGIGGGLFGSNNDCTRAQIVTFLYRSVK